MKKSITLFLLLLFTVSLQLLPAQATYQLNLGTPYDEEAKEVSVDSAGNQYVLGTYSDNNSDNMLLAKIAPSGAVLWSQKMATTDNDYGEAMALTGNGDVIIGGSTDNSGPGSVNALIGEVSASGGAPGWTVGDGISTVEQFNSILSDAGGYYASGLSFQNSIDAYVTRHSLNGNLNWSRTVGGATSAELSLGSMKLALTQEIVIYGATSQGSGSDDAFFTVLFPNGTIHSANIYGTSSTEAFTAGVALVNEVLIFGGRTNQSGNTDIVLARNDTLSSSLTWQMTYGGSGADSPTDMVMAHDGDIITVGTTTSFGGTNTKGFMMKTDLAGNVAWFRTYTGNGDLDIASVATTPDGGYVMAGTTPANNGSGDDNFYLIKTDSVGVSGCSDSLVIITPVAIGWLPTSPQNWGSNLAGTAVAKTLTDSAKTFVVDTTCLTFQCPHVASIGFPGGNGVCVGDSLLNSSAGAVSSSWSLNGNFVSSDPNYVFPADSIGTYQVELISGDGTCTDTTDTTITVGISAQILLQSDRNCLGDSILLSNISLGGGMSWWVIDGDTVSTDSSFHWVPTAPGNYSVVLLTDQGNCPDTVMVHRDSLPEASFYWYQISIGMVSFQNFSAGGGLSYAWDFGDGQTSTDTNPTHFFSMPLQYTTCLTVTDSNGCMDDTCQLVFVIFESRDDDLSDGLNLYPNPAKDQISLEWEIAPNEMLEIDLLDLQGRRVWTAPATMQARKERELVLPSLTPGTYLLEIKGEERVWSRKLLIRSN